MLLHEIHRSGSRIPNLAVVVVLDAAEPGPANSGPTHEVDVCVYGGTSGGVAAAVQAARMGKRVAIVELGRHLGGMTSGGLSAVDIGDPRSVGGIAREYFTRLVASYGKKLDWDQPFKGQGGPATGGAYSMEPHVASRICNGFNFSPTPMFQPSPCAVGIATKSRLIAQEQAALKPPTHRRSETPYCSGSQSSSDASPACDSLTGRGSLRISTSSRPAASA